MFLSASDPGALKLSGFSFRNFPPYSAEQYIAQERARHDVHLFVGLPKYRGTCRSSVTIIPGILQQVLGAKGGSIGKGVMRPSLYG